MKRKEDFKNIFPLISLEDKEYIMKLFKSTAFIPIGMLPSWKLVVELFLQKRYVCLFACVEEVHPFLVMLWFTELKIFIEHAQTDKLD